MSALLFLGVFLLTMIGVGILLIRSYPPKPYRRSEDENENENEGG